METFATQDVTDNTISDEEMVIESFWARLFSLGSSFSALDLNKDVYTFGRGANCDVRFEEKSKHFQAYSKVHFRIYREETSTGTHVFLEDKSTNGTFINSEKVGKGNKQVLSNNDEIALSYKYNKVYLYNDLQNTDYNLPKEVTEKYTLTKLLGKGACGEVKLGFSKGSCNKFAVKIIPKKKFSLTDKVQMTDPSRIMLEAKILKSVNHPCIIGVEEIIDTPENLFIVLELIEGGELFDRVISTGQLKEENAKLLFYQMANAVNYLHEFGITHRDLKPENILLSTNDEDTLIKVTDFGLSKFFDAGSMLKTFCGTPTYVAPEVLSSAGRGTYTKAIDCWSLGVILFVCLVGYPPFSEDRKDMKLPEQILGGHYSFPKQYWGDVSCEAIDLVKKLLTVDPSKRITLKETLEHPWLKNEDAVKKAQKLMYPNANGNCSSVSPTSRKRKATEEEETLKKKIKQ